MLKMSDLDAEGFAPVRSSHREFGERIEAQRDSLLAALVTVEKLAGCNLSDHQREITDAIIAVVRTATANAA